MPTLFVLSILFHTDLGGDWMIIDAYTTRAKCEAERSRWDNRPKWLAVCQSLTAKE